MTKVYEFLNILIAIKNKSIGFFINIVDNFIYKATTPSSKFTKIIVNKTI